MLFLCFFLGYLVWCPLVVWAEEVPRCEALVEQTLAEHFPSFSLTLRAGAKTTESLEARGRVYTGLFFELPLVDPATKRRLWREHLKRRKEIFSAIARLKRACTLLSFKKDLLEYHRKGL